MKIWLEALHQMVFPRFCINCQLMLNAWESALCLHCLQQLKKFSPGSTTDNAITDLLKGRLPITHGFALLSMDNAVSKSVLHAIKYGDNRKLALEYGRILALEFKRLSAVCSVDLIVPVPLHRRKEKERGYNQSELLARSISHELNVELDTDLVQRIHYTNTQTKKSKEDRWSNMRAVFSLKTAVELHGKHILLIDDVVTTGSTIEALASCFPENVEFSVLSLGFTP